MGDKVIKLDDWIKRVIDKLEYKIVPSNKNYDVVDKNNLFIDTLYSFITEKRTLPDGVIHNLDGDKDNWERSNIRQFQNEKKYENYLNALVKARATEKKKKIKPRPRLGNAYKKYKEREK